MEDKAVMDLRELESTHGSEMYNFDVKENHIEDQSKKEAPTIIQNQAKPATTISCMPKYVNIKLNRRKIQ